ncbi:MAG: ABC transporter permease [Alphaproteobacteria bacterium]|nr:ABC transporter permease [Pseudomonadota bacterium]
MSEIAEAFRTAFQLIVGFDAELGEIILLSLRVSLSAVALATLIGVPLGAAIALFRFPGRGVLTVLLNGLMGLPPVVVGLIVYLFLSRSGPLGVLNLLFSPTAMIIAQCVLVIPIIAALSRQGIEDLWREYEEQLRSLGAGPGRAILTLIYDGRFTLLTAVLAGFGRATAEVGAVMIVGGNIAHVTRVMTTAISLETLKGNLALALGLGIILIILTLGINSAAYLMKSAAQRRET